MPAKTHRRDVIAACQRQSRGLLLFTLLIILCCSPIFLSAQEKPRQLKGKITNEKGEPVSGASISEKNGSTLGVTNDTGEFSVEVSPHTVLVISSVGYAPQEIPAANESTLGISLRVDNKSLNEVVVVGYGTKTRATLTGAVSTIQGRELERSPATNLTNSIAGQLPGVIANTRSGEPGNDNAEIFIRGKGTLGSQGPLVVIDGIPDRSGGFARLNPADVASVTVLKDATAAIYGARAANGVILITTKRGQSGKSVFSFSANAGMTQPTRTPKMLNSYEYAVAEREYYTLPGAGTGRTITDEDLQKYKDGSSPLTHPNTNWWDAIMKKWTVQQNYVMSLSGGTDKVRYFLSGQYQKQEGNYKGNSTFYKQAQARANIDITPVKNFRIGLDAAYRNQFSNAGVPGYEAGGVYRELWLAYPYLTAIYPDGKVGVGIGGGPGNSMVYVTSDALGYQRRTGNYLQTKSSFNWNLSPLTKGLSLDGYFAYDLTNSKYKGFKKTPPPAYAYDASINDYREVTSQVAPELTEARGDIVEQLYNVRLAYNRQFGDHSVEAFASYEFYKADNEELSGYRRNLLSNSLDQLFTGSETGQQNGSKATQLARINYIGRVSYNFASRYLFDFNMRYDGSQNFPAGNRFGFFPGVSAAWRISQEGFFHSSKISELKLRASWGKIGNDVVPPFYYLQQYNPAFGYYFGNDAERYQLLVLGATPNPDITWEVSTTTDVGLEAQFLNGRFGFTVDLFRAVRSNILVPRSASVPEYTGVILPPENLGRVLNRGLDLEGYYNKRVNQFFAFNIRGTFTYARNKVLFIDETPNLPEYQRRTGYPIDAWSLFVSDGLFQNQQQVDQAVLPAGAQGENTGPGDIRYLDQNKDDVIDDLDRVKMTIGRTPEIMFGAGFGASLGQVDCNIFFQGQARAKGFLRPGGLNMSREFFEDRWQQEGDNQYPRNFNGPTGRTIGTNAWDSDFWLRDASFLRLKNVEIGYTLPKDVLRNLNMQSLRIYVNGSNLFSVDAFGPSFDPESPSDVGYYYPQQRIINVGASVTF